jgi:protein toll
MDSHWCRHEFRAAQTEASNERRNRIIVITSGDVNETDKMDEELQSYLRLHLYIKHEDPRFWQKLRYAMPHKKMDSEQSGFEGIEMKLRRV